MREINPHQVARFFLDGGFIVHAVLHCILQREDHPGILNAKEDPSFDKMGSLVDRWSRLV